MLYLCDTGICHYVWVASGLLVGFSSIFIYFSSLHVSGIHVPIIRRKLLYLYDTGTCQSVRVASGLLVGFSNIFIYFFSLRVSGIHVPIIRRKLLYLYDTGIYHCMGGVWSAGWIENPTSRPEATHTE